MQQIPPTQEYPLYFSRPDALTVGVTISPMIRPAEPIKRLFSSCQVEIKTLLSLKLILRKSHPNPNPSPKPQVLSHPMLTPFQENMLILRLPILKPLITFGINRLYFLTCVFLSGDPEGEYNNEPNGPQLTKATYTVCDVVSDVVTVSREMVLRDAYSRYKLNLPISMNGQIVTGDGPNQMDGENVVGNRSIEYFLYLGCPLVLTMGDSTPVTTAVKPTNIRNNNIGLPFSNGTPVD